MRSALAMKGKNWVEQKNVWGDEVKKHFQILTKWLYSEALTDPSKSRTTPNRASIRPATIIYSLDEDFLILE